MATDVEIVQTGQAWYVVTPDGRIGPMETQLEAASYLKLMQLASAAGNEIACTDAECFT